MVGYTRTRLGKGLINKIINHLPVELHVPGYQYCGPGTKLAKRLARGDSGINPLDAACKEHDIAYSKNPENIAARNAADKVLAERAWNRVLAKDASIGEKAVAWGVTNTMKAKSKLGMGLDGRNTKSRERKQPTKLGMGLKESTSDVNPKRKIKRKKIITLKSIIREAKKSMKPGPRLIESTLAGARAAVAASQGKVRVPRILPVPKKVGGILPFLIPILSALSATGALAGGAAGIAKVVNEANANRHQLQEAKRHNATMESIALGRGLYLKPYKKGMGLYLKPAKNS
jgi:hypothetical protein